ncbi:DUF11 domain-containing protein [Frankia sp. AiPs1]|uniref:DUF11 domain-containing protein n=1 Tax=Frankia sp. AiPs1 TaxID=573493 RepID=UPI002043F5D9|nr:DUF11 domain-containing protein [Frankia sp. AiPs1]MCM3921830.1 DUF11 domain-containing protein [Frankia sp. AiPs1]
MSIFRFGRVRGRLLLAAALLGSPLVVAGTFAAPPGALADEAPSPEHRDEAPADLSIAIDDGHTDVDAGDRLAYTIRIRNIGTADATDLLVTQTLPAGARFGSADRGGVFRDGTVTWRTGLRSGRDTVFGVRAEVTKPPPGLLRLAAVVCVAAHADSRPIVCAADSDRLPAGGGAAGSAGGGSRGGAGLPGWLLALCASLAAALALSAGLLLRYRRSPRHRRSPGREGRAHRADHLVAVTGAGPDRDPHGVADQEAGPSSPDETVRV